MTNEIRTQNALLDHEDEGKILDLITENKNLRTNKILETELNSGRGMQKSDE